MGNMGMLINFIDTGFIITLGILILVTGAVMLYCYRRLNMLENSVIEHGKILQNFIMNYNNQVIMSQQNQAGGLDNRQMPDNNNNEMTTYNEEQKISVSDDDDSDDESDDESDGESDDESDGGSESEDEETDAIVELV